jgi:formylmethanofuran dehydrogenase subunit D
MAELELLLISGRSTKQGTGISTGKEGAEYQEATNMVEMNARDMERAGLSDGDSAHLKSEFGEVTVRCRKGEVPEGLGFIAFGVACNRLIGGETSASGMPDSKHLKVELKTLSV